MEIRKESTMRQRYRRTEINFDEIVGQVKQSRREKIKLFAYDSLVTLLFYISFISVIYGVVTFMMNHGSGAN